MQAITAPALSNNIENKKEIGFQRNISLDVLRGVAVLLVLFNHYQSPATGGQGMAAIHNPIFKVIANAMALLKRGGWIGVDLFFVLSGFLVSGLLFNEYRKTLKIDAGRFLIRRGFKLYPSFIAFILFSFILEKIFVNSYPLWDYVKDILFVNNYFGGRFSHTWSLDVEEHFYLLLTFLFVIAAKTRKLNFKFLALIYIILLTIGIAGRLINNIIHPEYNFILHYGQTHTRLDALFFGVVLSYINMFEKDKFGFLLKHKNIIGAVLLVSLLPIFALKRADNSWMSIILLAFTPVTFGLLLIIVINSNYSFFKNRVLAYIGRQSYSIYLWHVIFQLYLHTWLGYLRVDPLTFHGFIIITTVYLSLSILAGIISTYLIEETFLKLRDKWYPSTSKVVIA